MYVQETVGDDVTGHAADEADVVCEDTDDVEGHHSVPLGPIDGPGRVDR
jgi:hypothetical protein